MLKVTEFASRMGPPEPLNVCALAKIVVQRKIKNILDAEINLGIAFYTFEMMSGKQNFNKIKD